MADRWCKLLTRTRTSGKLMEACDEVGPAAWALYSGLLMLHSEFGANGRIPATHCDLRNLRSNLPAFGMKTPEIRDALEAVKASDLIVVEDSGAIVILGWDDDVAPQCSQCRKPNHVPRYATCEACRAKLRNMRSKGNRKGGLDNTDEGLANTDEKLANSSQGVSRKEKDKDADLYIDGEQAQGVTECSTPGRNHSESAAAADCSLSGSERRISSSAGTPGPVHIGDILAGQFGGRAC